MWMDNYCSYWECHMTHATPATPRMCAWYLSGAKAQQAETFSKSLFAVMFPKVFVAGGAFYRNEVGIQRWKPAAPEGPFQYEQGLPAMDQPEAG